MIERLTSIPVGLPQIPRSRPGPQPTGDGFVPGHSESLQLLPSRWPESGKPQQDLLNILTSSMNDLPSARVYIFGATGDLVSKRAVRESLVQLAETGRLTPDKHRLVMVSTRQVAGPDYLEKFQKGDADSKKITAAGFEKFTALTGLDQPGASLMPINPGKAEDFSKLKADLGDQDAVFMAAVPPKAYRGLLENLKASGLAEPGYPGGFRRIVLEKPFGDDSQTAAELAEIVQRDFQPGQVLLIDHFNGYPGMSHMLEFRSAPEVDEALNSKYVEKVEVKLLETIKSNDRPYFRDTGILKDMVQNHAMQILATLALDLPTRITGDSLRQARQAAVEAVEIKPESVVRGQFEGFNDPAQGAPADAPPSSAETFVSFDMKLNMPRWQGVEFHLVNAKGVEQKRSGVDVHLRSLPEALARRLGVEKDQSATIHFTVNGTPKIEVQVGGQILSMPLDSRISDQPAYSNLISNALLGETALFATPGEAQAGWRVADEVEAAWRDKPMVSYKPGTAADQVTG